MDTAASQLHRWREEQGLSLRQAGDILRCDPSYVGYIERSERKPGRDLAIRIRDKAGIPLEAWGESSEPEPNAAGAA
jgi:transcriptional regulator with XRE-family HTH domain